MKDKAEAQFRSLFGRTPAVVARAPGRIEFIGNHTDYNGGKVLGAAIDRAVSVAVARRSDRQINLRSSADHEAISVRLDQFEPATGAASWANYPLGVLASLKQAGMRADCGFDLTVTSNLPSGAGLSSSAAFELATALALMEIYNFSLSREELVRVCRRAENEFVGMPCGILDQGVSAFGEPDHLVLIDCFREAFSRIPMREGLHFWIFNTNQKHSLVDSLYSTRHSECATAFKALQATAPEAQSLVEVPAEKLDELSGQADPVALKRARHIINEHHRVEAMVEALEQDDMSRVGQLLFESHESSRTLFENSTPALDFFVDGLKKTDQVVGARLTGGGFGGAVMALTTAEFVKERADKLAGEYEEAFQVRPSIFHVQTGAGASLLH